MYEVAVSDVNATVIHTPSLATEVESVARFQFRPAHRDTDLHLLVSSAGERDSIAGKYGFHEPGTIDAWAMKGIRISLPCLILSSLSWIKLMPGFSFKAGIKEAFTSP